MRRISIPSDHEAEDEPSTIGRPVFKSRKRKLGAKRKLFASEAESTMDVDEPESGVRVVRKNKVKMGVSTEPSGSGGEKKSVLEVLSRYETVSADPEPVVAAEAPVTIPDELQIKELKERRYRAQLDRLGEQKQQDNDEDYDSEHEHKTRRDLDEDGDFDVDLDDAFGDGRLAVGSNEARLQRLMRQDEIEEALYHAQLSEDEPELDYTSERDRLKERIESLQKVESTARQRKESLREQLADLAAQQSDIQRELDLLVQ